MTNGLQLLLGHVLAGFVRFDCRDTFRQILEGGFAGTSGPVLLNQQVFETSSSVVIMCSYQCQ